MDTTAGGNLPYSASASELLSRASYELGEFSDAELQALRRAHAAQLVSYPAPPRTTPQQQQDYDAWKARYPDMVQRFPDFAAAAANKLVAVFLDYDGTLAPIVNNPDKAFISEEMRETIRQTACLFPTAIISGRGREKVEQFVQLGELYYAGSHGLDIMGPRDAAGLHPIEFQPASKYEPLVNEVYAKLCESSVRDIPGSSVEHNKYCVSVHFRNCAEQHWPDVQQATEAVLRDYPGLQLSRGRKVLELKPKVDWHKGTALSHLLRSLGLWNPAEVLAIYIGDDRTDEDAFRTLRTSGTGFGILVSSKAKATEATYTLRDPAAVQSFLGQLVEWGKGQGNLWLTKRRCNGWEVHTAATHSRAAAGSRSAGATPAAAAAASPPVPGEGGGGAVAAGGVNGHMRGAGECCSAGAASSPKAAPGAAVQQ